MTMEDAHDVRVSEDESLSVYGVFDGHGGKDISEYLRDNLVAEIFRVLNTRLQADKARKVATPLADLQHMIRDCFFKIDASLSQQLAANCGLTAIVTVVVANRFIISANTGDLRLILSLDGGNAKTLSFDHKPSTMGERVRIENSGGYVINGRVNEILALSRAFGDFSFKLPWLELGPTGRHNIYLEKNRHLVKDNLVPLPPEMCQVSVEPEMLIYDLQKLLLPEFMILACDGIWDCFTNRQLVELIRKKIHDRWNLQHIVEYVLNDCIGMALNITGVGFDNMTLMIVVFHPNGTVEEWAETMEQKIEAAQRTSDEKAK